MSLYRIAGYLALVIVPVLFVALALGHPLDGLASHLGGGQ